MSRTRFVKGKIIKITGGNHNMYAGENIIHNSGGAIYEIGEEKGVSYGVPEAPPAPEIIAKCIVHFRPHGKWMGEYGLDWLRSGDTGMKGDTWFGSIMGKYYEADNKTPFQDTNKWNKNFHKEMKMYEAKLNSYRFFIISWKKIKGKPFRYTIPTLTLLKGKSAVFNLKIEIAEIPKKLTLEFKDKNATKYFDINVTQIGDLKKGKYDKANYLKITCKEESPTEQIILVKADDKICGALRIHPNNKIFQKNIKVAFIKVNTNINGITQSGIPISGGVSFFKHCFQQALVIPHLTVEPTFLDCTGNILWNEFKNKFCTLVGGVYKVTVQNGLRAYLQSKLKQQFGNKYDNHYVMFFIGEKGNWNGFSYFNSNFGVYFASHNAATLAHETMHAMNISHTFDGKSPQAKYTYEAMKTNNLLDYSHVANPPIPRFSLFLWQWKLLNPNIKPK